MALTVMKSRVFRFSTPRSIDYFENLPGGQGEHPANNTIIEYGEGIDSSNTTTRTLGEDNNWRVYAIYVSTWLEIRVLEKSTNQYATLSFFSTSSGTVYICIGDDLTSGYSGYPYQYYAGTENYQHGQGMLTQNYSLIRRFFADTPLITYTWTSVPAISGKNGILSLTMIKDDKIEEGTTIHQVLPEENIERYTDQSNMRKLCLNHVVNEWFTCAESGLNYMQLRYNYGGVDNDILVIEFKIINHYGEGNNQYYSEVYSGSIYQPPSLDGSDDAFLAFIIDEENEVAQFDPVTHHQLSYTTPPLFGVDYGYLQPNDQQMAGIYYFLKGSPEDIDEDDPYSTGSEGDGGDGNPYQPQDHLGLSAKPTKSGLNLGVVTLYNPSDAELASIAQFLWSDGTLENFKKYFNNFADNLMALYVLPVAPEAAAKASKVFKVGNLVSDNPSLQSVDYITDRYADIDMGSFYLKRKWDSYLDVSPYTKLEIYLPYCGTHQLNTDEIVYPANMEGFLPTTPQDDIELKLNYRIDLVTGNIVATLFINGENRYQFTGKCGMSIPLTGANYNNMVQGAITAGAGFAATIASGGLTAPLTASAAVSGTVMATKPDIYRSGNLSGDVSMLGYDTPYLIKTIPNKPKLTNQENYTGLPSYKKDLLGNFSGYTEVIEAHIDNVSCTDAERDKIMAYLKGGVLI